MESYKDDEIKDNNKIALLLYFNFMQSFMNYSTRWYFTSGFLIYEVLNKEVWYKVY